MERVKNEITQAIQQLGLTNTSLLDRDIYKYVQTEIFSKHLKKVNYIPYPLWDYFKEDFCFYDVKAWSWGSEFLDLKNVYLFIEDEDTIFWFEDGKDVIKVLAKCFGFVYYIVDTDFKFIICFNDHDILIVTGTAINWLKKYLLSIGKAESG